MKRCVSRNSNAASGFFVRRRTVRGSTASIGIFLNPSKRVRDVGRCELAAIMKFDSFFELEEPGIMVRIAPRFGENWNQLLFAPTPLEQWLDDMFPRRINFRRRMGIRIQTFHLNSRQSDGRGNFLALCCTLRVSARSQHACRR